MFVGNIWLGLILLPILIGAFLGTVIFGTVWINRRRSPFGWALPILAGLFVLAWVERDRNGAANPDSEGTIVLGMSDTLEQVLGASTYGFKRLNQTDRLLFTGDVVDVHFRTPNGLVSFPKVGGLSNSLLTMSLDNNAKVQAIEFDAQHNPMTLAAALTRAREIQAGLAKVGFASDQSGEQAGDFIVLEQSATVARPKPKTWSDAENLLGDPGFGISRMQLLEASNSQAAVTVTIQNWARSGSSIYDHNWGRQWGLKVLIQRGGMVSSPLSVLNNSTGNAPNQ